MSTPIDIQTPWRHVRASGGTVRPAHSAALRRDHMHACGPMHIMHRRVATEFTRPSCTCCNRARCPPGQVLAAMRGLPRSANTLVITTKRMHGPHAHSRARSKHHRRSHRSSRSVAKENMACAWATAYKLIAGTRVKLRRVGSSEVRAAYAWGQPEGTHRGRGTSTAAAATASRP